MHEQALEDQKIRVRFPLALEHAVAVGGSVPVEMGGRFEVGSDLLGQVGLAHSPGAHEKHEMFDKTFEEMRDQVSLAGCLHGYRQARQSVDNVLRVGGSVIFKRIKEPKRGRIRKSAEVRRRRSA